MFKTTKKVVALTLILASVLNTQIYAATTNKPNIKVVSQIKSEYTVEEKIAISVSATNYTGLVQYRAVLYSYSTKKTTDLITNKITKNYSASVKSGKGTYTFKLPKLNEGNYNLTFYVKRAGTSNYDSYIKTNTFAVKNNSVVPKQKFTFNAIVDKSFEEKMNNEEVFNQYATAGGAKIKFKDGQMYFTRDDQFGTYSEILMDKGYNQYCNQQAYSLTRTMINLEIAGKKHFVSLYRQRHINNKSGDLNGVTIAIQPEKDNYNMFKFSFNEYKELGEAPITIMLESLRNDNKHDYKEGELENLFTDPYYAKLLKEGINAILGEKEGKNVYQYIYKKYMIMQSKLGIIPEYHEEIRFEKVTVKFANDGAITHFSIYLNK